MNQTQNILYIAGLVVALAAALPVLAKEQNAPIEIGIAKSVAAKTKTARPSRDSTESQQQENQPATSTPNNETETQPNPSNTPYVTYDGAANTTR